MPAVAALVVIELAAPRANAAEQARNFTRTLLFGPAARAARAALSPTQRLPNRKWVRALAPEHASLVQIGANAHEDTSYKNSVESDPGPLGVRLGWQSLLVEPVPQLFARLAAKYVATPHVSLLNAAVCDACSDTPIQFHFVDVTNASGNWGSADADARCLLHSSKDGRPVKHSFIEEVASLSRNHVMQFERLFRTQHGWCERCAAAIGKAYSQDVWPRSRTPTQEAQTLGPACLRKVISRNIRSTDVKCACLREELARWANVSLLVVDAEGHDHSVLASYPFDAIPTARVVFEATHMSNPDFDRTTALLHRQGFVYLVGGHKEGLNIWHHAQSHEVLRRNVHS